MDSKNGQLLVVSKGFKVTEVEDMKKQMAKERSQLTAAELKRKRKAAREVNNVEWLVNDRRERNRVSAKKSRLRKKFYVKSLQEEVKLLRARNKELEKKGAQNSTALKKFASKFQKDMAKTSISPQAKR